MKTRSSYAAEESLARFNAWLADRRVEIDPAIEMRACGPEAGVSGGRPHYAVYANENREEGTVVARIPKEACLTALTTGIASTLQEFECGGALALVMAVMYERDVRKEDSPWRGYFEILPQREHLPVYFSRAELAELEGTELHASVAQDREFMTQDYEEVVRPFFAHVMADSGSPPPSRASFFDAASLVASRAFRVDDEHGDGMVPLADMFNHRTDGETIRIYGDEEAQEDDALIVAGGCAGACKGGCTASCEVAVTRARRREALDSLAIIAVQPLRAGDEVFNTFGTHGNAALLHKYGFCELDNKHGIVCLPAALVSDCVRGGEPAFIAAAEALGLSEALADDADAFFQIGPEGEGVLGDMAREGPLRAVAAWCCLEEEPAHRAALAKAFTQGGEGGEDGEDGGGATMGAVESLLGVLEARLALYPEDASSAEEQAHLAWGSGAKGQAPAGGGFAGAAAACVLRVTEKRVLEGAFLALVDELRSARRAMEKGSKGKGKQGGEERPAKRTRVVSGACYDARVVINR